VAKKINQIRQGDVLLVRVPEPAKKTRVVDEAGTPLAGLRVEGERTGHAHVLPARVYQPASGGRVLFVERPTPITHEEHGPIEVPAGWWQPVVQREYVPAARPRRRSLRD
jgi:hypothetical protein